MSSLKITRASGEVSVHKITPVVEWAFEIYAKKGFAKALLEDQKQSDVYWLAWELIRRSGETVKPFGADFLETLENVEILGDDAPNA